MQLESLIAIVYQSLQQYSRRVAICVHCKQRLMYFDIHMCFKLFDCSYSHETFLAILIDQMFIASECIG